MTMKQIETFTMPHDQPVRLAVQDVFLSVGALGKLVVHIGHGWISYYVDTLRHNSNFSTTRLCIDAMGRNSGVPEGVSVYVDYTELMRLVEELEQEGVSNDT